MNVNCSTCLELLTPSADLSAAPCGHIFHTACILQWFETGKLTCPHCRTKCTEKSLRRIFFTEGVDTSIAECDVSSLQNKIDSLTFQVRCAETEKKRVQEERDCLSARNVALAEEYRSLEQEKKRLKEELDGAKAFARYVKVEQVKCEQFKHEAEEAKSKLRLYKNVDAIIKDSIGEVNRRLHEVGDFSQASRELSMIIVALKKEMKDQSDERQSLKKALRDSEHTVSDLKSRVSAMNGDIEELQLSHRMLESDLQHSMEDRRELQSKVKRLEDLAGKAAVSERQEVVVMTSQVSVSQDDAVAVSCPTIISGDKENLSESPFVLTKSCSIVGLKRSSSTGEGANPFGHMNIMKRSRLGLASPLKETTNTDQFYNGLGGHSKPDLFPQPLKKTLSGKSGKGKSTDKTKQQQKAMNNVLDKYFKFDISP